MDLPNAKELKALLKVCRNQGVTDLKIGELEIKFGKLPSEQAAEEEVEEIGIIGPNPEELAYWSAQPDPLLAVAANQ